MQKALLSGGLRPLHPLWGCAPEPHWGLPSSGLRTTWLVSVSLSKGNSPHKIKLESPPPKFDETEEPVARIHAWMTLTKFWSRFAFTVYVANVQKALLSGGLRPLHPFPLQKIIKIVATRCQILRLKYTRFDFDWGSPQTPLGELTALPRPASWI